MHQAGGASLDEAPGSGVCVWRGGKRAGPVASHLEVECGARVRIGLALPSSLQTRGENRAWGPTEASTKVVPKDCSPKVSGPGGRAEVPPGAGAPLQLAQEALPLTHLPPILQKHGRYHPIL